VCACKKERERERARARARESAHASERERGSERESEKEREETVYSHKTNLDRCKATLQHILVSPIYRTLNMHHQALRCRTPCHGFVIHGATLAAECRCLSTFTVFSLRAAVGTVACFECMATSRSWFTACASRVPHSCERHDSFMSDMTCSYVWRDSFVCAT